MHFDRGWVEAALDPRGIEAPEGQEQTWRGIGDERTQRNREHGDATLERPRSSRFARGEQRVGGPVVPETFQLALRAKSGVDATELRRGLAPGLLELDQRAASGHQEE